MIASVSLEAKTNEILLTTLFVTFYVLEIAKTQKVNNYINFIEVIGFVNSISYEPIC